MKLYEIPLNSKIWLPIGREDKTESKMELCDFRHIDGAYSLIMTPDGDAVHLGASSEVELWEGGAYKLS